MSLPVRDFAGAQRRRFCATGVAVSATGRGSFTSRELSTCVSVPLKSSLCLLVVMDDEGCRLAPPEYLASYGRSTSDLLPRTDRREPGVNWTSTRPPPFDSMCVPLWSRLKLGYGLEKE
jgi:hypothetical protein